MLKSAAIIVLMLLIAAAAIGVTSTSGSVDRFRVYGGPGSLTLNWEPAPPGTAIFVGYGPKELPEIAELGHTFDDGSWSLSIQYNLGLDYHLYLDGFHVPREQYIGAIAEGRQEIALNTGYYHDPEPIFIIGHIDRVTLFGQDLLIGTEICMYEAGELVDCQTKGKEKWGSAWRKPFFFLSPAHEQYTFTVAGIPVEGVSINPDPRRAPFRVTLDVGQSESSARTLYGSNSIVDRRYRCGYVAYPPPIYMFATDGRWTTHTRAKYGGWELLVPGNDRPITVWADEGRDIRQPLSGNAVVLTPGTSSTHVEDKFLIIPPVSYEVVVHTVNVQRTVGPLATLSVGKHALPRLLQERSRADTPSYATWLRVPRNTEEFQLRLEASPEDTRTLRVGEAQFEFPPQGTCDATHEVAFVFTSEAEAHSVLERLARTFGSL